jgi:acetolactate synthase-1/2/3 large subunit
MIAQHRSEEALAMNGATALLRALHAGGADICFANPGTTELTLVAALADVPEIRPVLCLFEGVCTGAADGYARISGKIPLTLLHLGPGFANGIANLHNARRAHSKIVTIIGDHATWHLPHDAPLTSDIESLAHPVSVDVVRIASCDNIAEAAVDALNSAARGAGGPSTIIASTDLMDANVPGTTLPAAPTKPSAEAVSQSEIDAAVAACQQNGELILLLGGNALSIEGQRAAEAVAAATGAKLMMEPYPAVVTLGGDLPRIERQAYFPDDVIRQFGDATLILAGARRPISYFGYEDYPSLLVPDERLVVLSRPDEDGVSALKSLADGLGAAKTGAEQAGVLQPPRPPELSKALTPNAVVDELLVQLPEDSIVSVEGSTLGGPWLREAYRARRHRVMTNTGGAIGQGLPCAVGAALAARGHRVIALQSDGSAHYTVQSLWTMAREKLPVTIVLAANHRYGILQTELKRSGTALDGPTVAPLTKLDDPCIDWRALAEGYGVPALRATTAGEFRNALKQGLATNGPLLIQAELP